MDETTRSLFIIFDNWTVTPAEATSTGVETGKTVTLKYTSSREVKSVKAKFKN